MIVSYPLVNEDGTLTGCEVSFRLTGLLAIAHMDRWVREPRNNLQEVHVGNPFADRYERVAGCVTVYLSRGEFDIQADYDDLLVKMKALDEWKEDI